MTQFTGNKQNSFDRTNAIIAAVVFIISFIIYAMTVQRSFSYWDCGEFIACSYTLGIPHPPGTPLFVILGRIFSMIPFVEDISYRVNYLSVIGSSFTAMFSYLLTVRMVGYFFGKDKKEGLNKFIAYIGGFAGSMFVAFSQTNWANSVEAEVYGMALALSVAIVWLTVRYFEQRGTLTASRTLIFAFYLAMLGVGIHMTVYLVVPVCAIFFLLNRDASPRDWSIFSGFIILELLLIIVFSDGRGGAGLFYLVSMIAGLVMLVLLYKKINWAVLIGIGAASAVMMSFSAFFKALPIALALLTVLAILAKKYRWQLQWKTGLMIVMIAFIGVSVHLFIPIRSAHNPRIDENNPSRDFTTFVNYLDRKQYGQMSMIDRMFNRRGEWSNQLGRHPHMGFWSYFEEQYSSGGQFIPFFILGLIGIGLIIKRKPQIGMPFLTLLLLTSVGLVLYMNFADGTQFDPRTGDAYLEVRNRDYFFTPAFVFFGVAMGLGISALMHLLRGWLAKNNPSLQYAGIGALSLLVLLPAVSLAHNYHICDRSKNFLPYNYAANLLDGCEPNAILFTSGDNDTFPIWCIQEVYGYRTDVRVVNLSLLNTDWYVAQMKNKFNVPISLTDEQILWYPVEERNGVTYSRPLKPFYDKPRKRQTYLQAARLGDRVVRVQDMMTDEIVIENNWKDPIYFTSPPYAESPLNLRDYAVANGLGYRLDREPNERKIDVESSYNLFMNVYRFGGFENSEVYRDENATGVFLGYGVTGVRLFDELLQSGDTTRAMNLAQHLIDSYPEYWQSYLLLSDIYMTRGDTTKADQLIQQLHDTLTAFHESNKENLVYEQDLGVAKVELGMRNDDQALIDEGLSLLWSAFEANANSVYSFRKLITVLNNQRRYSDMRRAAQMHGNYKMNLSDPLVQSLLGMGQNQSTPGRPPTSP